jgi:peptidoglycan/xylan/chitin deacetylase (PgdA/CDA1 family)
VVDLGTVLAEVDRSSRLPGGMTALTFDDGFASVYEHALPLLRESCLPATFFLVAATLVDERREVDWVDKPPPWPLRTLTRDQVLEMRALGFSFGSHTYSHPNLTALTDEECGFELSMSREVLEDLLHVPITTLAYPRGLHDDRVRGLARRAGYRHAFALPGGPEPFGPLSIPRVGIYRGNRMLAAHVKMASWYPAVRRSFIYRAVTKPDR